MSNYFNSSNYSRSRTGSGYKSKTGTNNTTYFIVGLLILGLVIAIFVILDPFEIIWTKPVCPTGSTGVERLDASGRSFIVCEQVVGQTGSVVTPPVATPPAVTEPSKSEKEPVPTPSATSILSGNKINLTMRKNGTFFLTHSGDFCETCGATGFFKQGSGVFVKTDCDRTSFGKISNACKDWTVEKASTGSPLKYGDLLDLKAPGSAQPPQDKFLRCDYGEVMTKFAYLDDANSKCGLQIFPGSGSYKKIGDTVESGDVVRFINKGNLVTGGKDAKYANDFNRDTYVFTSDETSQYECIDASSNKKLCSADWVITSV